MSVFGSWVYAKTRRKTDHVTCVSQQSNEYFDTSGPLIETAHRFGKARDDKQRALLHPCHTSGRHDLGASKLTNTS